MTNNVEVIQAQQQLASANDQYIASLYAHNIAKVLLARSIGNAEQMVKQYMAGNHRAAAVGSRAHSADAATRNHSAGVAESTSNPSDR